MTSPAFLLQTLLPQQWLRGDAKVIHGALELDLETAESYELRGGPRLAFDLASVHTQADAITFIRRHGMLSVSPATRVPRESWQLWESTTAAFQLFIAHIYSLGPRATRIDQLNRLREWWPELGPEVPLVGDELELMRQGANYASILGNLQLAGTELALQPSDDGLGLTLAARTPDLRSRAFAEAAILATSLRPVSQCGSPKCGRLFEIRDPRRRFCSPRCASRERQARHRTRVDLQD